MVGEENDQLVLVLSLHQIVVLIVVAAMDLFQLVLQPGHLSLPQRTVCFTAWVDGI